MLRVDVLIVVMHSDIVLSIVVQGDVMLSVVILYVIKITGEKIKIVLAEFSTLS